MQNLGEIFRRNRTVIMLFAVLVILPSLLLGYLGFRAIRSNNLEQQFEQRKRQTQVALMLNDEVKSWLFSEDPRGAVSQAFLRFTVNGDRLEFPDLHLSFPAATLRNPLPVGSTNSESRGIEVTSGQNDIPDAHQIEEIYYPRI